MVHSSAPSYEVDTGLRSESASPEKALLFAVIQHALKDIQAAHAAVQPAKIQRMMKRTSRKYSLEEFRKVYRSGRQALVWAQEEDGMFAWLCELLEMDAEFLREGMMRVVSVEELERRYRECEGMFGSSKK